MDIDFDKDGGLVPVIVQDATTSKVLMMAYMNSDAYSTTIKTRRMTFFSRSRNELWTKGETSGNYLDLVDIKKDCDGDALLAKVIPAGPACHTGDDTCWGEVNEKDDIAFITYLESVIESRKGADPRSSYTAKLFDKGVKKISQKVGEEAVELILEAGDDMDDLFLGESADLVYHLLVLLHAKGYAFPDIIRTLRERHKI